MTVHGRRQSDGDDLFEVIAAEEEYRVTIFGANRTGKRRDLATVVRHLGVWRLSSEHLLENAIDVSITRDDEHQMSSRLAQYTMTLVGDVLVSAGACGSAATAQPGRPGQPGE